MHIQSTYVTRSFFMSGSLVAGARRVGQWRAAVFADSRPLHYGCRSR